ncbi:protein ANTAGONIST OF LIKE HETEROCHROMATIN PROTEIN 1-like [Chelonus insularis]|uniref:protein ANTAGONIST OF LIKE HETEROCHROMATIN PROTEIN 1-like n=1 Tax=Chelonus insularis TaxID=460826 RepID=UPI00158850D1|nr:protein ANTAGONIST OF LIKE HETEROCHROMATIN PROTEIN 1-like [Chelonus insularis]
MSDKTFKSHFRVERSTVDYLMNLLGSDLSIVIGNPGRSPIPVYTQILIALWMMATPDSYRSVCERFDIGKATGWRTVWKFVKALYKYLPTFIKWPSTQEALITAAYIDRRYGFPGVIGAVDGTHINIPAPHLNAQNYINRKGRYSIQTQVVCDHTRKFIHVHAGEVGSVHDARVFRLSGVQNLCVPANFPQDTHLLGDQAYSLQPCVMVPYKNNRHLTNAELHYNRVQSSARIIVEQSIGLLKGRFRSLLDKLPIRRTDLIPYYIVACCILHNICILQDDLIQFPIIINGNVGNVPNAPPMINNTMRRDGMRKRERIKNAL